MPDFWATAALLVKLMLYVGAAWATGLVLIRMAYPGLVEPLRARILAQTAVLAGIALAAAVFGFALRGAALTGTAGGMADPEMLGLLWQTSAGNALVFRAAGALLLLTGLLFQRTGPWISLSGGLLLLWSFTRIGHIPAAGQPGLQLLLFLHLAGIAFWIGVLSPLRDLARRPEHLDRAALLGHRFGQAAMVIVPGLFLAGLLMAWQLLGHPEQLLTTGYGQMLLLKLMLISAVLILAALNKLRLVPALQEGKAHAGSRLARSIEIEASILLAVLTATATLTSVLTLPN